MRIKSDFVTNSSSTCYILALNDQEEMEFNKFMSFFNNHGPISVQEVEKNDFEERFEDDELTECLEESRDGKIILEVYVSDELGYGLIENTKFRNNIVISDNA